MIGQINELPEDGLKSSPKTSRYIEDTWFSRNIKISCTFVHLIDILKVHGIFKISPKTT